MAREKKLTFLCEAEAHRANTYPFVHDGIISALLNLGASVPFIQRFEVQHGTLASFALFFGRESFGPYDETAVGSCMNLTVRAALSTFPAFLYVLLDRFVFHSNDALMGAR